MMRDFNLFDELFAVIKEDGTFAGQPCTSLEEAIELANQHEGSYIYLLKFDNENFSRMWGGDPHIFGPGARHFAQQNYFYFV